MQFYRGMQTNWVSSASAISSPSLSLSSPFWPKNNNCKKICVFTTHKQQPTEVFTKDINHATISKLLPAQTYFDLGSICSTSSKKTKSTQQDVHATVELNSFHRMTCITPATTKAYKNS